MILSVASRVFRLVVDMQTASDVFLYRVINLDLSLDLCSLRNVGLCLHELLEMYTANVA